MRILLDNCVTADLMPHIRGHDVTTAVAMGWAGLDDGPLLDAIAGRFDILLTVDRSLPYQQRIKDRTFAVVVLCARNNRVEHLARLIPALLKVLKDIKPGDVREIGPD